MPENYTAYVALKLLDYRDVVILWAYSIIVFADLCNKLIVCNSASVLN
jgi:hypothetical protein